jgi:hypothetical protein
MDEIPHADYLESRARLLINLFWVADDYRIEKGIVRPLMAGKPVDPGMWPPNARRYLPLSRAELPAAFARAESDSDVLSLVRTYGLLGYKSAFHFYELPGAVGYDPRITTGDPVSWVLAHARQIKLVMELAEALGDLDRLTLRLEQLAVRNEKGVHLVLAHAYRGFLHPAPVQHRRTDNVRRCALEIIAHALSPNLQGVARTLIVEHVGPGLGLSNTFKPRNLMDCIYWMLADAVTAGMVQQCAHCHRPFIAHGKTRYCPPLLDQQGISPCMNRDKQRRFRTKARAKTLRAEGLSVKRIAKQLGEEEGNVRVWVNAKVRRAKRRRRIVKPPPR